MRKFELPIGHLSASIRAILSIEEEEALLGRIRIKGRRAEKDDKKKGGRWHRPASFDIPGPFSVRPISPSGTTSFHFSMIPVTRGADKSLVLNVDGKMRLSPDALADHDKYISRPGAVEAISPSDFDRYLNRDGAFATEDHVAPALFTNIDPDPAVRASYWNAVCRCERKAGPDKLIFTPDRLSRASWQNIANLDALPEVVRNVAAQFAAQSKHGQKARKVQAVELPATEAKKVIQLVKALGEKWPVKAAPLRIAKGRGGRVQYRITTEFPAMLDAGARVRIAQAFCLRLEAAGIMYVAAIHAPDHHNDARNYHLHIAMHDRPAKKIGDLWDFEISRPKEGQYNRLEYPHRQNKIADFARDPDGKDHRLYGSTMIKAMRESFAEICNEEIVAAGSTRFFDPRTFEEMGIEREPTAPLGTRAAPLEAAGVATKRGTENAEVIWSGEFGDARREAERRSEERRLFMKLLADASVASNVDAELRQRLVQLAVEYKPCAQVLDHVEGELLIYDVSVRMVRARPDRTIETCDRLLEAIRDGKANRSEVNAKSAIESRGREAKRFLRMIDSVRQVHGHGIEHSRRNAALVEAKLAAIVEQSTPLLERNHDLTLEKPAPSPEKRVPPPSPITADRGLAHRLLDRILQDGLHVLPPEGDHTFYRVAGVTREELRALKDPAVVVVAQKRLGEIYRIQAKRIHAAADALTKVGQHRLEIYATQSALYARILKDVRAYQEHPAFIERVAEPKKASEQIRDDSSERRDEPHLERYAGAIKGIAQRIGKFRKAKEHAVNERSVVVEPEPTMPLTASSNVYVMPPRQDTDRAEAVQNLANAILTDRSLKVFMENGALKIDASAAPQWAAAVHAFEAEGVIISAVRERHDSPWLDCDAEEISRTIATVEMALNEMPGRPVVRQGRTYHLTCPISEITEIVERWQGFDRMQSALMRVHIKWRDIETKETKRSEARIPARAISPAIQADPRALVAEQQSPIHPSIANDPTVFETYRAWRSGKDGQGI